MDTPQTTHLFKQLAKLRNNQNCTEAIKAYNNLSIQEQNDFNELIQILTFMTAIHEQITTENTTEH